jgi:flagellar FliL protein
MMSKLKIVIPLALVLAGGAYKFALAKPAPAPKPKVQGEVYVLPKEFLVNLSDGHLAKLSVGLVFKEGYTGAAAAGGEGAAPPPDGYGTLPQEALVRDIVTDTITDAKEQDLTDRHDRDDLKEKVAKRINKTTDVKVDEVLFTDVVVQ